MKKKLLLSAIIAGTLVLSGCNLLDRLTSLIPGDESSETSSESGSSGGHSSSSESSTPRIELSQKTAHMDFNTTLQLTVTFKNMQEQAINWSSSNASVVSVNAGLLTSYSVKDKATITAKTADSKYSATCSVTVSDKDAWTILVYMCGSNLESGYGYEDYDPNEPLGMASEDISEMLSVNGQPDDINIVLECGGAKGWKNSQIKAHQNKLSRWTVENKTLVHKGDVDKVSMGASTTLSSFITWGLQQYPAEKVGLILWNHGGAMQGVCQDENANDMLSNSEVKSACQSALSTLGMSSSDRFEFIAYDACLMAVQDIAEFNSHYFNYMLCAEETEAGEGYDYTAWLDNLYAYDTTPNILKEAADGFINAFQNKYGAWYANDQTQSVLDLSKMAAYKAAFEDFASSAGSCISSYNGSQGKSKFQSYLRSNVKGYANSRIEMFELEEEAEKYGETVEETIAWYQDNYDTFVYDEATNSYIYEYGCDSYGSFDVVDFMNQVAKLTQFSSLSTKMNAVKSALSDLVIYNNAGAGAGESHGLALFFSTSNSCYKSSVYSSSETNFTNWRTVVNSYGA